MLITPSTGLPSIFDRWITAADRLGPRLSGYATSAYTVRDVAQVLATCAEPSLAASLRRRGPIALCSMNLEDRSRVLAKADPTLGGSLRHRLQCEALEMEHLVGTESPFSALVLGGIQKGVTAEKIMTREFRHQRGAVFLLDPPSQDALTFFRQSRHQLFWNSNSPPPRRPKASNLRRLPRPESVRPPIPGELWNLSKLARLNLLGHFYLSFAAAPSVCLEPGDVLRLGALVLESANNGVPFPGTDILLASGEAAASAQAPLVFLRAKDGRQETGRHDGGDHAAFFLGDARESYARIDFDPYEHSLSFKIRRTRNGHFLAEGSFALRKDTKIDRQIEQDRAAIQSDLEEADVAEVYAEAAVSHVLPLAAQYLEWLERRPEAPLPDRERKLADLENSLMSDLPKALHAEKRDLVRRDFYRVFEHVLKAWGAQEPRG